MNKEINESKFCRRKMRRTCSSKQMNKKSSILSFLKNFLHIFWFYIFIVGCSLKEWKIYAIKKNDSIKHVRGKWSMLKVRRRRKREK